MRGGASCAFLPCRAWHWLGMHFEEYRSCWPGLYCTSLHVAADFIPLGFLPAAVLLSAGAGDAAGPRLGVSPPALAAAAAAASASLERLMAAGSSSSSPSGSPKAGAVSDLDNVDDELPVEGSSVAAAAAASVAPAGEQPHLGALAVAEVGAVRVCKCAGPAD